jgi:hypothetical protein
MMKLSYGERTPEREKNNTGDIDDIKEVNLNGGYKIKII